MEDLLKEKINKLAIFLIDNCKDDNKKLLIKQKLSNLQFFEIIMFIQFLDNNNLEKEINSFILLFSINDTEFVREELNKYLNYFMKIKNILNK